MKVCIGRAIEGISLNGLEYLLDSEGGEIMEFDSKESAKQFLIDAGENPEAVEELYLYTDSETNEIL